MSVRNSAASSNEKHKETVYCRKSETLIFLSRRRNFITKRSLLFTRKFVSISENVFTF